MRLSPVLASVALTLTLAACSSDPGTGATDGATAPLVDGTPAEVPGDTLYEETQYVGFDACAALTQALAEVFPEQETASRDPYVNFNATGEWINGCTVESTTDPFGFSNLLTVRTYADPARAMEMLRPVEELPDGTGMSAGQVSDHGDASTAQDTSTYGYDSTILRYVVGNHYVELQVGGEGPFQDKIEEVATALDALIPAYGG